MRDQETSLYLMDKDEHIKRQQDVHTTYRPDGTQSDSLLHTLLDPFVPQYLRGEEDDWDENPIPPKHRPRLGCQQSDPHPSLAEQSSQELPKPGRKNPIQQGFEAEANIQIVGAAGTGHQRPPYPFADDSRGQETTSLLQSRDGEGETAHMYTNCKRNDLPSPYAWYQQQQDFLGAHYYELTFFQPYGPGPTLSPHNKAHYSCGLDEPKSPVSLSTPGWRLLYRQSKAEDAAEPQERLLPINIYASR